MQWLKLDDVCGVRSDMAQMKEEQPREMLIIPPDGWSCGDLCSAPTMVAVVAHSGSEAENANSVDDPASDAAYPSFILPEMQPQAQSRRRPLSYGDAGRNGGSGGHDDQRGLSHHHGEKQTPREENIERMEIKLKGKTNRTRMHALHKPRRPQTDFMHVQQ